MGFRFEWADEEKTVMRYVAEGAWKWKDYHRAVQVSVYSMMNHPHPVDTLIDLRGGDRLPAGLPAHAQTFGKKQADALTGSAVVIGLPEDAQARLGVADDRMLKTRDGVVCFVQTDEEAQQILGQWRAARQA